MLRKSYRNKSIQYLIIGFTSLALAYSAILLHAFLSTKVKPVFVHLLEGFVALSLLCGIVSIIYFFIRMIRGDYVETL